LFSASLPLSPSFSSTSPSTPQTYTLSLHDALPICISREARADPTSHPTWTIRSTPTPWAAVRYSVTSTPPTADSCPSRNGIVQRSEEHTSELQSRFDLVCRLLLEKKKQDRSRITA